MTQLRQRIPLEIRQSVEKESTTFLESLSENNSNDDDMKQFPYSKSIEWNALEQSIHSSTQMLENSCQVRFIKIKPDNSRDGTEATKGFSSFGNFGDSA